MSREERRNYERMMRNMERGPSLPAAAKARAERNAARRAARQPAQPKATGTFTRRFVVMATLIAIAVGYLAFSILWPTMPLAAYAGVAAAVSAAAVQVGLRVLQRRVASR
jgi:hypothetical protein